jgi:beta-lactamase class A
VQSRKSLWYGAGLAALIAVSAAGIGVASASSHPSSSSSSQPSVGHDTSSSGPPLGKAETDAIERALQDYINAHGGNVSIAVYDRRTGLSIGVGGKTAYQTASIVKVDIVAALMLQHQADGSSLTAQEMDWAQAAITRSDNDAASNLFGAIGGATGLSAANATFGLVETHPSDSWGMTTTTADDQIRLLRSVSSEQGPLTAQNRQLLQGWMSSVIPEQAFGVPSGKTPAAKEVYLKDGWVDLDDEDGLFATHSIGRIVEDQHDWLIAVLSDHNATFDSGKSVIDGTVAEAMSLVRDALG